MNSYSFCFAGRGSELVSKFYPHIELTEGQYEVALLDVEIANTIANVDSNCNKFYYYTDDTLNHIELHVGSYDIDAISSFIQSKLPQLKITANPNTMKVEISSPYRLDFSVSDSIGKILGYSKKIYDAGLNIQSDNVVDISPISVVRIDCNLCKNSFVNGVPTQTIFQSPITVDPGYRQSVMPQAVVYLPINRSIIDMITLRFVDIEGNLIDFRGEKLSARLHLRKV